MLDKLLEELPDTIETTSSGRRVPLVIKRLLGKDRPKWTIGYGHDYQVMDDSLYTATKKLLQMLEEGITSENIF